MQMSWVQKSKSKGRVSERDVCICRDPILSTNNLERLSTTRDMVHWSQLSKREAMCLVHEKIIPI
jgi:hypothetical protein